MQVTSSLDTSSPLCKDPQVQQLLRAAFHPSAVKTEIAYDLISRATPEWGLWHSPGILICVDQMGDVRLSVNEQNPQNHRHQKVSFSLPGDSATSPALSSSLLLLAIAMRAGAHHSDYVSDITQEQARVLRQEVAKRNHELMRYLSRGSDRIVVSCTDSDSEGGRSILSLTLGCNVDQTAVTYAEFSYDQTTASGNDARTARYRTYGGGDGGFLAVRMGLLLLAWTIAE